MWSMSESIPTDLSPFTSAMFCPPACHQSSQALRHRYYELIRLLIQHRLLGFHRSHVKLTNTCLCLSSTSNPTEDWMRPPLVRLPAFRTCQLYTHHIFILLHMPVYPHDAMDFPVKPAGRQLCNANREFTCVLTCAFVCSFLHP